MSAPDPGNVPMPWRIKTIGGSAYSVGGNRKIYKRVDLGAMAAEVIADIQHLPNAGQSIR